MKAGMLLLLDKEILTIMHQSIPAVPMPPPPRAKPRALAFFLKNGQIPRGGDKYSVLMPRGGDEERGQMPCPRDRQLPTPLQFF